MWLTRNTSGRNDVKNQLIAVAVDKSKGSQAALKWAIDNLLQRGQLVVLVHVKVKNHCSISSPRSGKQLDPQTKSVFLPFRCFATRRDIQCWDVVVEDVDIPKALIEFVAESAIEVLLLGATSKGSFLSRFSKVDTGAIVSKGAPEFCTVYVISKTGKISSMRSASRSPPTISSLRAQIMSELADGGTPASPIQSTKGSEIVPSRSPLCAMDDMEIRTPSTRGGRHPNHLRSYGDIMSLDSDISFVSSGRPSMDSLFPSFEAPGSNNNSSSRVSTSSDNTDYSYDLSSRRKPSIDMMPSHNFSNGSSDDNSSVNWSNMQAQAMDDVEAEMRRLKSQLKQTINMYSDAYKEALSVKQKTLELQQWKAEEERKMEDVQREEDPTRALIERERAQSKAAMEAVEAHRRIAEIEAQKRINAEMKALKEAEGRRKVLSQASEPVRYRKYTIEEIEIATNYFAKDNKIGEGGYGPVFRCYLDHTLTAVKVLRPDAAQGRSQFQQEVEVLSCIRHPNMVLLLGACPEYGCLVYEYMHNGSLEDRLFCRGGTPPLPWQHRFRIAAEIATGLLFLHQTKPEPLVHRDLKPANILLDRNLVSKIGDVGLARLVPPDVAEDVTQYRMTSAAGTFCYIDPEYQQTGMLGVKSDVYSLGIMLLQIITARPPMGLTHNVETAIEAGKFEEMLDPKVPDWPVEEALSFAKMALRCAEMRRKDRPDLGSVVLPELNRLRTLADESLDAMMFGRGYDWYYPTRHSQVPVHQEVLSGPPSQDSSC